MFLLWHIMNGDEGIENLNGSLMLYYELWMYSVHSVALLCWLWELGCTKEKYSGGSTEALLYIFKAVLVINLGEKKKLSFCHQTRAFIFPVLPKCWNLAIRPARSPWQRCVWCRGWRGTGCTRGEGRRDSVEQVTTSWSSTGYLLQFAGGVLVAAPRLWAAGLKIWGKKVINALCWKVKVPLIKML